MDNPYHGKKCHTCKKQAHNYSKSNGQTYYHCNLHDPIAPLVREYAKKKEAKEKVAV